MSEMWAAVIDRSLYYEGRIGTAKRRIRAYRGRAAIEAGAEVEILRLKLLDTGYEGGLARVLVKYAGGERWADATDFEWQGEALEITTTEGRA